MMGKTNRLCTDYKIKVNKRGKRTGHENESRHQSTMKKQKVLVWPAIRPYERATIESEYTAGILNFPLEMFLSLLFFTFIFCSTDTIYVVPPPHLPPSFSYQIKHTFCPPISFSILLYLPGSAAIAASPPAHYLLRLPTSSHHYLHPVPWNARGPIPLMRPAPALMTLSNRSLTEGFSSGPCLNTRSPEFNLPWGFFPWPVPILSVVKKPRQDCSSHRSFGLWMSRDQRNSQFWMAVARTLQMCSVRSRCAGDN